MLAGGACAMPAGPGRCCLGFVTPRRRHHTVRRRPLRAHRRSPRGRRMSEQGGSSPWRMHAREGWRAARAHVLRALPLLHPARLRVHVAAVVRDRPRVALLRPLLPEEVEVAAQVHRDEEQLGGRRRPRADRALQEVLVQHLPRTTEAWSHAPRAASCVCCGGRPGLRRAERAAPRGRRCSPAPRLPWGGGRRCAAARGRSRRCVRLLLPRVRLPSALQARGRGAVRCARARGRAWSMSYCSGCHCVGSSLMSSLKRGGRSYTCRKPLGTGRCSPASRCAPPPSCSRPPLALATAAPPAPAPAPSGAAF